MNEITQLRQLPNWLPPLFLNSTFALFLYVISWFCLWNISYYLLPDFLMAGLFLPSGLKLAVYALSARHQWHVFTLGEIVLVVILISFLSENVFSYFLLLFSLLGHGLAISFRSIWLKLDEYWKKLLALCCFISMYATICGTALLLVAKPLELNLHYVLAGTLSPFTGSILLTPFFYLLYDNLTRKIQKPLHPVLEHQEVMPRVSALIWYVIFFSIGLLAEFTLLDEMKPLALLLFLLPNIFMAYRYGWKGGVLASVMNSILLLAARQVTETFGTDLELQSFMATQALIGIGLGIAISRQNLLSYKLKEVNLHLQKELASKKRLARQLVRVEEDIRKSVARELHDEIGQNITAIQTQSMLVKRITSSSKVEQIADTTNDLAMRIHTSTRHLLKQLRPHVLDEMSLEIAIRQIVSEMGFDERSVIFKLNFGLMVEKLDEVTTVTIYRVLQELLNNVCKHANASEVQLTLIPGSQVNLELRDNGVGLPNNWRQKGQGLRGIEERIQALGGHLSIVSNDKGSRITVNLPTKSNSALTT